MCSELRGNGGTDLPVVFLSGTLTEAVDRVAGLLLGADDFIVKPADPGELLARVAASSLGAPRSRHPRSRLRRLLCAELVAQAYRQGLVSPLHDRGAGGSETPSLTPKG